MRRFRILLVLVFMAPLSGCYCLEGWFGNRQDLAPGFRAAVPTPDLARTGAPRLALAQDAWRDPDDAFCLACAIAGGGHFYTGETPKAAALLGIAAAGLIGGAVLSSDGSDNPLDCDYDIETHDCESEGSMTPLLVGAGVAAASWVYGIIDSRASADRMNTRNGLQVGDAGIEMRPLLDAGRGGPRAGMQLRVTW